MRCTDGGSEGHPDTDSYCDVPNGNADACAYGDADGNPEGEWIVDGVEFRHEGAPFRSDEDCREATEGKGPVLVTVMASGDTGVVREGAYQRERLAFAGRAHHHRA